MSPISSKGRRQFLQGVGGFTLALPFLPSLLPATAKAQSFTPKPRFISLATQHGGIWGSNMYPQDRLLSERINLYSDHEIKRGDLELNREGSRGVISPVLSAEGSLLTSRLVQKMNVIRGLDIPFYIAHHTGGHLGNFARNDGNGGVGEQVQGDPRPTIDQVMAWSSSFYDDLSNIKERSLHIGQDGGFSTSWGYSNPQSGSGQIQAMPTAYSSQELFSRIFVAPTGEVDTRTPVVDRVLENYKRLRNGAGSDAKRLSSADRSRLDDHMDRLAELQRKLGVVAATCQDISEPADVTRDSIPYESIDPELTSDVYKVFNDVIVAAMICGTSRIATVQSVETWSTFAGDWHQDIAHQSDGPDGEAQSVIANAHQRFFEGLFVDLMVKLDVEEADGRTYLDNSLLMWTQESGMITHDATSLPVVTAGSAAGFFHTGNYVDYRNQNVRAHPYQQSDGWLNQRPGILYTGWLGSVLQSMGLSPSEYQRAGENGYGNPTRERNAFETTGGGDPWPDRLFPDASKIVPFLKA